MKPTIYNYVAGMTTHANPSGAATTWVVSANTRHVTRSGFYRAMLCIRGTSHGPVSVCVCLSVCLSVTSRSSTKTAKHRITQTTPHDKTKTLVF